MGCIVQMLEKPELADPVLIEGLPGIGFVANISALHLIRELEAKRFARIRSSAFQDFAVTTKKGQLGFPINELYYHKGRKRERDLIILYGNTQALTTFGQYELSGRVLNITQELGCRYVITLGGLRVRRKVKTPKLRCAASDSQSLEEALSLGARKLGGQIFGMAGLLVALGRLRGMRGFCLLAETPGFHPDVTAAREVLNAICKRLQLQVDLSRLDATAEATRDMLEAFSMVTLPTEKRAKKSRLRWLI
ncbi:proteasome assembly chaperone family protein [Candidatus Bathyarchaeota archaeon]|nr:proteasome assembly chaperone family protein [Candidatus Bathyarchaeota archaeon]NIR16469.1 proteasome assembly chaperone family protein [Desulfobacterales bacterium]NIU81665.1 proteasome assembly chaperone family protein [Candidatus Bathyarchaeota archaeon]NIV68309.1 proteasome assembly chaperone family protein [Candidatus Bathyarchaeota archaeon]NIW16413.1 proteasome assembly chaperone family protein [Candidatus Bathyarchaeota archaeon]